MKFHRVSFLGMWQENSGRGNGLALNRRQVITWTCVEQVLWYHMASLGFNVLAQHISMG